ncbi:MAG: hypothetical protein JRJ87_25675 [Deltaproteobacteria bacterium]|nr:hypothetical protein [Deltaproteobacteria bacterium]
MKLRLIYIVIILLSLGHTNLNAKSSKKKLAEFIKKAHANLEKFEVNEQTGKKRGHLFEKIGDVERKLGHQQAAHKAYLKALNAYSTSNSIKSRRRLLSRLSKSTRGWSKKQAAFFKKICATWKNLHNLCKKAGRLPRRSEPPEDIQVELFELMQSANEITELAKKIKYLELLAWALELEGRLAAASGYPADEQEKYTEAAKVCSQGACAKKQREILFKSAHILEKQSKNKKAYSIFSDINFYKISMLPEEKRRYSKSKDMIRVCNKLRTEFGTRICYVIEKKTTGFPTYRDFSSGKLESKLSRKQIKAVHSEYLHLLTNCLTDSVKNGEVENGEKFELDWAVTNEGRAVRFKYNPVADPDNIGKCFKEALEIFRYPRYRGQRQNITLPLAVNR